MNYDAYTQSLSREDAQFLTLLGTAIRTIRQRKNMQQIALAAACNFEKSNLSRIEAGKTNPTYLTLVKIARALDITTSELLKHAEGLKPTNGQESESN